MSDLVFGCFRVFLQEYLVLVRRSKNFAPRGRMDRQRRVRSLPSSSQVQHEWKMKKNMTKIILWNRGYNKSSWFSNYSRFSWYRLRRWALRLIKFKKSTFRFAEFFRKCSSACHFFFCQGCLLKVLQLKNVYIHESVLTLRHPTCHSWHIKLFFSSPVQRELLCQNCEKITPLLKPNGFLQVLSTTGYCCWIEKKSDWKYDS